MKLAAWCLLTLFRILLPTEWNNSFLINLSHQFHELCSHLINTQNSPYAWFYKAVLLGEDTGIRQKSEVNAFMALGIYHIIVVSGSHLTLLQKILGRILFLAPSKIKSMLTAVFLTLFTLANQWQAACLRAFLAWILKHFWSRNFINAADLQIFATLGCLLLDPSLSRSLSFQLSCTAGAGVAMGQSLSQRGFLTPILCVVLTAPLIFQVQPCLSWLIIPVNIFALSLVEIFVLPLSLVNVFLPFTAAITEPCLKLFFKILEGVAQFQKPLFCIQEQSLKSWGFIYVACIYFFWRLLLPVFIRSQFRKSQAA